MDIADTSRWLLERALKTYDDNDDFVNLEVKSTHVAESVAAPNDSILTALVNDETSYTDAATRPFLTQSAEVELYLLATNFLVSCSCASLCLLFHRSCSSNYFQTNIASFDHKTALCCHGHHFHVYCKSLLSGFVEEGNDTQRSTNL